MRRKICRNLIIPLLIIIAAIVLKDSVSLQLETTPSLNDYTAYPPFISQLTPPNVLIVLDKSGSMQEFAYKTSGYGGSSDKPDTSYNPSTLYYGYFNPSGKYAYSTSVSGNFYPDPNGKWNGNFLNWLTMRRIDVVKKVLVGGKALNRADPGITKYLVALEDPDRDFYKKVTGAQNYTPFSGDRCFKIDNNGSYEAVFVSSSTSCGSFSAGTYTVKVHVGLEEPLGVVQKTWDRIRYGLMLFNNNGDAYEGGGGRDGGYVSDWITGPGQNVNLLTNIENADPSAWTPLAESFYEATRYFRAGSGAYQSVDYAAQDPINEWCQRNFVLILTDGESTKDRNIPGGYWGTNPVSDPDGFNVKTYMDRIASNEGYSSEWNKEANTREGTYYLEGVAYWSHIHDLRDMEGTQDLTSYVVYAFDDSPVGKDLLRKTAKYGGFKDRNGNNKPDLKEEWDADNDGYPDTYYEATDGERLETSLIEAIESILNRASSGTAASVLSTSGEGEGAVFQAYFNPRKLEGSKERTWLGYINALFLDPYGNLREDTVQDKKLDLTADYIIQTVYDPDAGTFIKRYQDTDGDGEIDVYVDKISLDDIRSIWNGGKILWQTDPAIRKIYTTTDGYTFVDFKDTKRSVLRPYLRAIDDTEAGNIINYIRGVDITGYRERSLTLDGQTKVWKLGDIIFSTPNVVSKPKENYDLLYGDASYAKFRKKYINRRQVVFLGANDGMLHAFNGGFYDPATHKFWRAYSEVTGTYSDSGSQLGEELWAFIPRELLPHLKWLTDQKYTHVYYVDLRPKITDVKIFNDDGDNGTHPGGWGTILIGGMRYGGKAIQTDVGTFRSTYFALDVTDPEQPPRLLWTFDTTDSGATDLGLTMSYPAILKVGNEWYAVFGSGPTNFNSSSNLTGFQEGKIFVLQISGSSNGVISSWSENINYWRKKKEPTAHPDAFMASPTTIDVNNDYNSDVVYIGVNYQQGGSKEASALRLTTMKTTAVSSWKLSEIYTIGYNDPSRRISASPSPALDNKNNLWVYFGTGQFLGVSDKNQADTGAFYGIKDSCWNGSCSTTYSDIDLVDVTGAIVYYGGSVVTGVPGASSWSQLLSSIHAKNGWSLYFGDMPSETTDFLGNTLKHTGEKVITKPVIIEGLVMFNTYVPGADICTLEGDSNLYVLYYETGTAYSSYIFRAERERESKTVSRVVYLGKGLPSSIGVAVTKRGELKGFVQSSTGEIVPIQELDPDAPRSGYTGWKAYGLE